jgi:hypothetical protein
MSKHTILLAAVAGLVLALAGSAQAAIIKVNANSSVDGSIDASAGGKTITIDAGGSADFLIVGTSTEFGTGSIAGWNVTYDGNKMTWATGNGSQNNIFYLDLTQTTYGGGNASLKFSWDYIDGGDLGVGWVSVRESTGLDPGESIALHKTGFSTGSTAVDLVTTVDGTFNFVNFNGNKGSGTTLSSNLTKIYANASFGSNAGAAGYKGDVAAGTHTYSWNQSASRRLDAAAFVVVPEPATLALMALGGLGLVLGRKRR